MLDVKKFLEQGYIVIPNSIPKDDVDKCKDICLSLKNSVIDNNLLGTEKNFGNSTYWRGIDVASYLQNSLYLYYTSDLMYDIAKNLLQTDTIYLFNDQIVAKLPNEDFDFPIHTDNEMGPNPELAKSGGFKTITCAWVLDDFTIDNGPISILNNETNEWDTPLPKKGDIVVWDGNTLHKSSLNISNKERVVWLCIYSTHNLLEIPSTKSNVYKNYYNSKFEVGKMMPMTCTYQNRYMAQQTLGVWELFKQFLLKEKFERILEIGTGLGGFTQFLYEFSKENDINTEIMTVDIKPSNEKLIFIGIKSVQMNVLNVQNLPKLDEFLKTNKKLLILCDGDEKSVEFNLFSKYVKVDDFIMAHDYAISYEYFEKNIKHKKKWDWCEIVESDIEGISNKFNLVEYTDIDFKEEMWICKTKKENTKKQLF